MTHLNDEQLILHFYGDAEGAAEIQSHLRLCADCRRQFDSLKGLLATVEAAPALQVPERPAGYEKTVWNAIEPRLDGAAAPRRAAFDWRVFLHPKGLALAGAVAALLIAAFLAGRITQPGGGSVTQPTSVAENGAVRERILLVAVGEHLDRSQMVLLELTNASGSGTVDISTEQKRARDLVDENRLYRQTALTTGDTLLATELEQLERTLVEIANSPSDISSRELDRIRKRLEDKGVMFKLRVLSSDVKERAKPQPATDNGAARKTT